MPVSANDLDGTNGFKVNVAGGAIDIRGDFNGDGYDDVIIGSASTSQTFVVFGGPDGFPAVVDVSTLDGASGFVINGATVGAVTFAGDLNGDGRDDIAIGAPSVDTATMTDAGTVYVVYGAATAPASLELSSLDGSNGFALVGEQIGGRAGYSLDTAGDFNGDGYDDLLIGAPVYFGGYSNTQISYSYAVYGGQSLAASTSLSTVGGTTLGVRYAGGWQDQLGVDVTGLGDVNGDGAADIFLLQYYSASVGFPGQPMSGQLDYGPPGTLTFYSLYDDARSISVSSAGDFDADGFDDFLYTLNNEGGGAGVIFGSASGLPTSGYADYKTTFRAIGVVGHSVAAAGDFNGDGIDDVVVGAGTTAYVLFGSASLPSSVDLRNLAPDQGLAITDVGSGARVAGAGDVNGDGYDDIAIASSLGTWVVFGGINVPPLGTEGDDTMTGTPNADTLYGFGGNDVLIGLAANDILRGDDGNDVLDGGTGNDRMDGGAGSDTFYVDSSSDIVIDPVAEGVDRVATSASFALQAAADIETLEAVTPGATTALDLTGNNYSQTIVGNDGANRLNAGGGADTLYGLGGNDVLAGDDGDDAMHGGAGDDTYYAYAGDQVIEWSGQGRDRVAAVDSLALAAGMEIEVLEAITSTATTPLDLAGNEFANVVVGNAGINVLDGGNGNDVLTGLGGNDTLRGGDGDDVLEGGSGHDRMEGGRDSDTYYVDSDYDVVVDPVAEGVDRVAVAGSYTLAAGADIEVLEALTLSTTHLMTLTGNEFATRIVGNDGANTLDGKGGGDVLIGGGGADTFAFTSALGAGNVDTIEGFQGGADKIALSSQVFATIAPGSLGAGGFHTGSGASDGDDRIVYDQASGALYYDPDGTGAAAMVQFARLEPNAALAASDFILI